MVLKKLDEVRKPKPEEPKLPLKTPYLKLNAIFRNNPIKADTLPPSMAPIKILWSEKTKIVMNIVAKSMNRSLLVKFLISSFIIRNCKPRDIVC